MSDRHPVSRTWAAIPRSLRLIAVAIAGLTPATAMVMVVAAPASDDAPSAPPAVRAGNPRSTTASSPTSTSSTSTTSVVRRDVDVSVCATSDPVLLAGPLERPDAVELSRLVSELVAVPTAVIEAGACDLAVGSSPMARDGVLVAVGPFPTQTAACDVLEAVDSTFDPVPDARATAWRVARLDHGPASIPGACDPTGGDGEEISR